LKEGDSNGQVKKGFAELCKNVLSISTFCEIIILERGFQMKRKRFSGMCTVIGVLLGLIAAWVSIAPQTTNGEVVGGIGCYCQGKPNWSCTGVGGCNQSITQCDMNGGYDNGDNCDAPPDGGTCGWETSEDEETCNNYPDITCNDDD